jgi:hypothetical protein
MFFNRFGTTQIDADAPPYSVVQACRRLGFHSPEDVRWCHQNNASPEAVERPGSGRFRFLKSFFGKPGSRCLTCLCGRKLPRLESYSITLGSGENNQLLLAQCRRCKTIFWKEP